MKYHFSSHSRQQRGFTLIETALSLTLVGIAIAALVVAFKIYTANLAIETTKKNAQTVARAIENFILENGRFPCAAAIDLEIENPRYGHEADCSNLRGYLADGSVGPDVGPGDFAGGIWVERGAAAGASSLRVVRGMVPFQTLNLPEHYVNDGYGSRLFYAVTAAQANADTFMREGGGIGVIDGLAQNGNDQVESNHFIVFSAGPNRMGAYSRYGKQLFACAATGLDAENCNTSNGNQRAIYRAAQRSAGADSYDDYVVNSTTLKLPLWRLDDTSAFNMRTIDLTNRVMMGAITPVTSPLELTLDVSGAARSAEGANFHGGKFCLNGDGTRCFDTDMIAGERDEMDCESPFSREAPGQYMRGIAKSEARCANDMAFTCPAGNYISGMNGDGTPACRPYVFEPPPLPDLPDQPDPPVTGCILGPEVVINDYDGWQGELDDPTPNNVCYGRNYIAVEQGGNGTFRDFEGGCGALVEGSNSPSGACLSRITHNGANWADATRCEVFAHLCAGDPPPPPPPPGVCNPDYKPNVRMAIPGKVKGDSGYVRVATSFGQVDTSDFRGTADTTVTVGEDTQSLTASCAPPNGQGSCTAEQTLAVGGVSYTLDMEFTVMTQQDGFEVEGMAIISCNGGTMPDTTVNGQCGAANTVGTPTEPAADSLCQSGVATAVADGGTEWTWSCQGSGNPVGTTADCSAPKTAAAGCWVQTGSELCLPEICGPQISVTSCDGASTNAPVGGGCPQIGEQCTIAWKYGTFERTCQASCGDAPVDGACRAYSGAHETQPATDTATGCTRGQFAEADDTSSNWEWVCAGENGGVPATCQATRASGGEIDVGCGATQLPINLNCMAGETIFMDCTPTQRGYQRSVESRRACPMNPYSDTQQWGRCVEDPTCVAAPECGSANNTSSSTIPSGAALCNSGNASSVVVGTQQSSLGQWGWTCSGPTSSVQCSATIIGRCGSAAGVSSSSAPTQNLCDPGTPSEVTGSAQSGWNWTCFASNDPSCSAPGAAVTASCQVYAGAHASQPADSTASGCTAGEYSDNPDIATAWSWSCTATSGGATSTATCSATRQSVRQCPHYPEDYPPDACTPQGNGWQCCTARDGCNSVECRLPTMERCEQWKCLSFPAGCSGGPNGFPVGPGEVATFCSPETPGGGSWIAVRQ